MKLLNRLFDHRTFPIVERNFDPPYLLSEIHEAQYRRLGYTVLEDCVPEMAISELIAIFEQIEALLHEEDRNGFINTGSIDHRQIKEIIRREAAPAVAALLRSVLRPGVCRAGMDGSYLVKPPGKTGSLNPHQDSPVIDEDVFHAAYVWIPLHDMKLANGALQVLPGSHLWGNYPRPLVGYWPFHEHKNLLMSRMKTLEVKKGDLIVYDSATIHASPENQTDKTRLAFVTTLLPINAPLVHHHYDGKGHLSRYIVDRKFYMEHPDLRVPPGAEYALHGKVPVPYDGSLGRKAVKNFIRQIPEDP